MNMTEELDQEIQAKAPDLPPIEDKRKFVWESGNTCEVYPLSTRSMLSGTQDVFQVIALVGELSTKKQGETDHTYMMKLLQGLPFGLEKLVAVVERSCITKTRDTQDIRDLELDEMMEVIVAWVELSFAEGKRSRVTKALEKLLAFLGSPISMSEIRSKFLSLRDIVSKKFSTEDNPDSPTKGGPTDSSDTGSKDQASSKNDK